MQPKPQDYGRLLGEIKERIRSAQYEALRKVNRELISLYWDIGRLIVERQRDAGWGKSVVETLASDLQAEFPGIGGFSAANLWRMRHFYDTYAGNEKLAPMVREIGWSHNLIIGLVAIELKFGEVLPEYVGKMQFYLAALDDRVRMEDENPSIGIILCKSKNKTIVEYALRESTKPIGVASYRVVSTLPEELRGHLPAPDQVSKLLEDL